MPRKDGTPTAAERKNAERIESNRRYVRDGKDLTELDDATLTDVRAELADDPDAVAVIDTELGRRIAERSRSGGGGYEDPGTNRNARES